MIKKVSLSSVATDVTINHNYNKILISDGLSTVLISALIGQCRTVLVMPK